LKGDSMKKLLAWGVVLGLACLGIYLWHIHYDYLSRNDQLYEGPTASLSRDYAATATVRLYNRDNGYRGRTVQIREELPDHTATGRVVSGEDVDRNGHWTKVHVCLRTSEPGPDHCVEQMSDDNADFMSRWLYADAVRRLNAAIVNVADHGHRVW
jgi:hypothetical protein